MDFTCTAMRRPDVLKRTLESFAANLRGVDMSACRLAINIDPLPGDVHRDKVLEVACEYFGKVRFNAPRRPDFGAAFKWVAAKSSPSKNKPFCFHIEDDWELQKPVEIGDMIAMLEADETLAVVNLRAYPWENTDTRICLSPGLWRSKHMHKIADRLVPGHNPEKQLRAVADDNPVGDAHEGFTGTRFPVKPGSIVIRDIGRDWLKKSGQAKDTADPQWNRWEAK